jgi:hypothetical protein
MSAIDEGIVREYFEQNGFLVRQARKYQVQARRKTSDEEIDLLVYNPAYQRGSRKPDFFLFSTELPFIHCAIVVVLGWHTTSHFTAATLKGSPEIFAFLEDSVVQEAARFFPVEPDEPGKQPQVTKILVLPGLPTTEPHRTQSVQLLQERGVDAIISFRSMLLDIVDRIETNRNYRKSDTLQLLRILKTYDLLKATQLDLLPEPAPRRRAKGEGRPAE